MTPPTTVRPKYPLSPYQKQIRQLTWLALLLITLGATAVIWLSNQNSYWFH